MKQLAALCSPPFEDAMKSSLSEPRSGFSPDVNNAGALILDFQSLELCEVLICKPHSQWYSFGADRAD